MVAIGIGRKGQPSVLRVLISPPETKSAWQEAFSSMKARGIGKCDVVASDGFVGMREIAGEAFSGAAASAASSISPTTSAIWEGLATGNPSWRASRP